MNKVNVSIDDVCPHPLSSIGVIEKCEELRDTFPEIKFSLFIPAAYWRTIKEVNKPDTTSLEPYDLRKYPDFCNFLSSLPEQNYEFCYHGLFHGIPGVSNNDEFKNISYRKAQFKIRQMKEITEGSGINFQNVFRPPAWRLSPGSFNALIESGIDTFALSSEEYAIETYGGLEKEVNCVMYNVNPPFKPLELMQKTEIVYHACEWDKNYLSLDLMHQLREFLELNRKSIEFNFIKGLL